MTDFLVIIKKYVICSANVSDDTNRKYLATDHTGYISLFATWADETTEIN